MFSIENVWIYIGIWVRTLCVCMHIGNGSVDPWNIANSIKSIKKYIIWFSVLKQKLLIAVNRHYWCVHCSSHTAAYYLISTGYFIQIFIFHFGFFVYFYC